MQRYTGFGSLGLALPPPIDALVQVVQKHFHIWPPVNESAYTGGAPPLLERPLVSESGSRTFEFHFPLFYEVKRVDVRQELFRPLSNMINPLLNKKPCLRGDNVTMIYG